MSDLCFFGCVRERSHQNATIPLKLSQHVYAGGVNRTILSTPQLGGVTATIGDVDTVDGCACERASTLSHDNTPPSDCATRLPKRG